eukprot:675215-Pyramimonas_sp.AAC.1
MLPVPMRIRLNRRLPRYCVCCFAHGACLRVTTAMATRVDCYKTMAFICHVATDHVPWHCDCPLKNTPMRMVIDGMPQTATAQRPRWQPR